MNWDDLFADLEAQFDALERAELASEVADRTRRERARIRLVDRLRASVGRRVVVHVSPGTPLAGVLERGGPDWLLLSDPAGEVVVPTESVGWVSGLSARAEHPIARGHVAARLDLAHVLRGISRDRTAVTIALVDGGQLHGTVDRVGADHLDLADHEVGEPRRPRGVRAMRVVPFAAIAYLRRRPD